MIGTVYSAVARVAHSAAALQQTRVTSGDSVVVESPLPGGVAETVRFLLNAVPQWVQIGGVVVAIIVATIVLRFLILRRLEIRNWLASRSGALKLALAATSLLLVAAVGGVGAVTWNYTQHSNDFCIGCHIMNTAFQRFTHADNKHSELSCHDCHQQSLYASARQMYLWVAERPQEIGPHAKVANTVCENCHVTGDTATWQRVASTAGHRVHLESDSSSLKDLQCVTCHGVEVHRFKPVSETCGQSGCHPADETGIVLGKMATQTVRHCAGCHAFAAEVPAIATRDSARGTLVPGKPQCLGCHEMQKVLPDFNEAKDPHGGKCGSCHNPHLQKTPALAAASCATSGCHANWRDEPFHVGASHRRVGAQCITCHVPHSAKVDASDCQACHETVRARSALRPPVRFDTARVLRRIDTMAVRPKHNESPRRSWHSETSAPLRSQSRAPDPEESDSPFVSDEAPQDEGPAGEFPMRPPAARQDSFPHSRHVKLACLECHQTGSGHGRLTFEPPRGCAICHHEALTQTPCASCHQTQEYSAAKQITVTVQVDGHQPNPRTVEFFHARHEARPCLECHSTPVTRALSTEKAQCRDCHTEHHAADRTCSSCHKIADPKVEHKTLESAHLRCDACHTTTTIEQLTPTRSLCSTCHVAKAMNHYDARECSVCHFLAEPAIYRAKLLTPPRR